MEVKAFQMSVAGYEPAKHGKRLVVVPVGTFRHARPISKTFLEARKRDSLAIAAMRKKIKD